MEREILFRGKRLDGGEWVEGNYYESDMSGCFILQNIQKKTVNARTGVFSMRDVPIPYEVDPDTVGQYTGQDIQGVKLFDGDIIRRNDGMVFRVAWSNLFLGWDAHGAKLLDNFSLDVVLSKGPCEIIGNIWDTPELLEVKK